MELKKSLDLDLKDVIYNSYHPQNNLQGYIRDNELSGRRQQVYINPENNQLLFSVAGTQSGTDVLTDGRVLFGGIKNTERYKHAEKTLKLAKDKYQGYDNTIVGSSLGGAIASRIASNDDKVYTYNSAEIGGKNRNNTSAIRHSGDVISIAGLDKSYSFGNPLTILTPINWLSNHSSKSLKNQNIII